MVRKTRSTNLTNAQANARAGGTISKRGSIRDFGLTTGSLPVGRFNSITDIAGVKVGHVTLVRGSGKLVAGRGPVRTGVTVVLPNDDIWRKPVSAGAAVMNGCGEVTGLSWVKESGRLEVPVALTTTLCVGRVHDAILDYMLKRYPAMGSGEDGCLPVVGECDDSTLNDAAGRHVKSRHVLQAIAKASSGHIAQGAVGAGTGMICYEFKGGIGTSSRRIPNHLGGYTVGALVNSNHDVRSQLRIADVPVGTMMNCSRATARRDGSIIIVLATDAPLSPLLLSRLAQRSFAGMARTGSAFRHGSGDFCLAFSTTRIMSRDLLDASNHITAFLEEVTADAALNALFEAAIESVEEAILNALFNATTTIGRDNNIAPELPIEEAVSMVRNHG